MLTAQSWFSSLTTNFMVTVGKERVREKSGFGLSECSNPQRKHLGRDSGSYLSGGSQRNPSSSYTSCSLVPITFLHLSKTDRTC